MKINKLKIIVIIIIVISAVALFVKFKKGSAKGEVIKEVTPVYGDIQTSVSTTGVVQPQNRLEIKPPINGRVEEILVVEGQKVKAGQVLAWMSSTERAALLDAARTQGATAIAYWKDVYKPTPLVAPIDAQVIVRSVEPGQTMTSSDPVIVLSDRLIVQAQVDETDVGKVKLAQEASISLDAYPLIKAKGKVDHIYYESKTVNNVTIYEVDILPDQVPDVFRSGMSANVDIIEESRTNVLMLANEAVKQGKHGTFVFVKNHGGDGKKPTRVEITTGIADDKNTEIISGLEAEDVVLIMPEKANVAKKKNNPGSSNPLVPFGPRGGARR
jgi:macrolide-specific efflux system membrane fusion protein